jgi:hypothetical protein
MEIIWKPDTIFYRNPMAPVFGLSLYLLTLIWWACLSEKSDNCYSEWRHNPLSSNKQNLVNFASWLLPVSGVYHVELWCRGYGVHSLERSPQTSTSLPHLCLCTHGSHFHQIPAQLVSIMKGQYVQWLFNESMPDYQIRFITQLLCVWAEIHQALLSLFSHLAEFFIDKGPVKDSMLVNLSPGYQIKTQI